MHTFTWVYNFKLFAELYMLKSFIELAQVSCSKQLLDNLETDMYQDNTPLQFNYNNIIESLILHVKTRWC